MLKHLLEIISKLLDSQLIKTKLGKLLLCIIVSFIMYGTVNNTITLNSVMNKIGSKKCGVVINKAEAKHLAILASRCNNSKSDQCFVSRWCIEEEKTVNRFKARIYELISCYLSKGEICHSIVLQSKYERPLYISSQLLNRSTILDNNSNCGYITRKEMKRNKYKEFVEYSDMLAIQPSLYTYCIDDNKMTLLIQRENHNSLKTNDDSFVGCLGKYCLIEVIGLHTKLKKITQ